MLAKSITVLKTKNLKSSIFYFFSLQFVLALNFYWLFYDPRLPFFKNLFRFTSLRTKDSAKDTTVLAFKINMRKNQQK